MAECPVCGSSDGLHVWLDDDEKLGVHCFPCGANVKAVGEALELLEPDEDAPAIEVRRVRTREPKQSSGPATTWEEYATDKELDLEVLGEDPTAPVRFYFNDEDYKERMADGSFRWSPGAKAKTFPLWPPIEDLDVELPETIYITEGETDRLTLTMNGLPAWSITGGANPKGALDVGYFIGLRKRGVRTVILCNDADTSGVEWYRAEELNVIGAKLAVGRVDMSADYDRWGYGLKDVNDLWMDSEDSEEFLQRLEERTSVNEPKRSLGLDELFDIADEDIEYLINELVSPHEKGLIIGPQKTYKTWIALNMLRAVATGDAFLDRQDWTAEAGSPVLLIEEEGSKQKFARRIRHVFAGVADKHRENFHLWFRHGFRLTDDDQVTELIDYIRNNGIKLVVLDPLQRLMPGVEENSAADTSIVWDNIHRIAGECAVVIIHHMNKVGGLDWNAIRGSSRTGGEVDFAMFVKAGEESGQLLMHIDGRDLVKHESQEGYLAITFPKSEPWKLSSSGFTVDVTRSSGRKAKVSEAKILDALAGGPLVVAELLEATELHRNTLERTLDRMQQDGTIMSTRGPRNKAVYQLVAGVSDTEEEA